MKVAFFTHYSGLYGANRCLLSLIQGLKAKNVEPLVFLPKEGPMQDKLVQSGTAFSIYPYSLWVSKKRKLKEALKKGLQNFLSSRRLARTLKGQGFSLIHSNSSATNIGALVASRLGLPHVWHVREFGDLDYGSHPEWGRRLFLRSFRRSHAVVFMSEALRRHFGEETCQHNGQVIYDGIASLDDFQSRRQQSEQIAAEKPSDAPFTFILAGLMQPKKGQDLAIRAFHRLEKKAPNVRMWLVGSGSDTYVEHCRALAAQLGVENKITFWGFVDDPNRLYCEADCGLMCSQSEGFGLVTVEAMSFCKPVIGFNGGATPEIVKPEENGLLYSGGEEELAACMERMVAAPNRARELGQGGWRFVSGRFTTESHATAMFSLYNGILGGGRSAIQSSFNQPEFLEKPKTMHISICL